MIRTRTAAAMIALSIPLGGFDASAGNISDLEILGFNADASIFAFEEHGIQDGSGFPYVNRFYIDVATDGFVPGTPIRVRIDDENATLDDARAQARTSGQAIVADAELAQNRGYTAGVNAITELSADPHRMAVNPRPVIPPIDEAVEFRLEEYELDATGCENLGPNRGYRLLRVDLAAGGAVSLLHEDSRIPSSRGCPLGYRIGTVQTVHPDTGLPSFAVLIAVRSFGFEGPNFHWIAVAGRL